MTIIITCMFYYNNPNNALHFYSFEYKCKLHFSTFKPFDSLPTLHHNSIAVFLLFIKLTMILCHNRHPVTDAVKNKSMIKAWKQCHLCLSSLQVEVSISLLPPVACSGYHRIVLILSSAVSVNWALVASEVRGHVRVYVRQDSELHQCVFLNCTLFQTLS